MPEKPVIVVCHHGAKLSEGTAAWLRQLGADAVSLEGGFVEWEKAKLPLVPVAKIPPRDSEGRTVWVTRARPKIDRIACPWLIRRFIDPAAVFLFVAPQEVAAVADRFSATAFDIENTAWSHRGELCTFDVMVEEFGLGTEALCGWPPLSAPLIRPGSISHPKRRAFSPRPSACRACMPMISNSSTPAWGSTMPSIAGAGMQPRKPTIGPPAR